MITIQSIMLIVLGILCASLVVLLIAPAYWKRAVRLTTKQLKETLPISETEMRAQMDRIRAEYAMRVHRLETQKKESKLAATRRLIEINRRDASVSALESDLEQMKASLEENQNARRVLEQTVADRLPKVEQRLAEAKHLLFNRDKEIAAARDATNVVKQAFDEATQINEQQSAQINRLNMSLATRAAKRSPDPREAGFEVELALRSEVEAMRAKTRDQSALISRLQSQMGEKFGAAALAGGGSDRLGQTNAGALNGAIEAADVEMSGLKDSLVDAQNALQNAARGFSGDDAATRDFEATIRKLTATNQDQTGEVARLRAALATFEGGNEKESRTIRDSKIALKARLNAVQVQAEQQSAVIAQLRTQLAAAHERTALQAQHFKTEMRRLGAGTMPAAGMARRAANITRPSSLAERIAQPRDDQKTQASSTSAGADEAGQTNGVDRADRRGRTGRGDRYERGGRANHADLATRAKSASAGSAALVAVKGAKNGASDEIHGDKKHEKDVATNIDERSGKSLNVAVSDLSDKVKEAAASIGAKEAALTSGELSVPSTAGEGIAEPAKVAQAGTTNDSSAKFDTPAGPAQTDETVQPQAGDDGSSVMERMARNKKSKWKTAAPEPAGQSLAGPKPLVARLEDHEGEPTASAPASSGDEPKSETRDSGPKVLVKPKISNRDHENVDDVKPGPDGAGQASGKTSGKLDETSANEREKATATATGTAGAKAPVAAPARRAKPRLLERLTGMAKGS